jgi:hypothetical protein
LQCRRAGGDGSRAKFGLLAALLRSRVGHENSNLIEKNGEQKNRTIINMHSFLTVLFASPLFFDKHKRETVAAGQKYVCELRYHGSCDLPKNSNLIEKMVSKKTVKTSKLNRLSPFFFALPLCFNKREKATVAAGQKYVCELRYQGSRDGPKYNDLIEKMVSATTVKLQRGN